MRNLGRGTMGRMAAVMVLAAAAQAVGAQAFPDALFDCVEGQPCASDGNACTLDVCHNNQCTHPYNDAQCPDDGDLCTVEVCLAPFGDCATAERGCYDANPCTDDACSPASGCVFTNNSAPCNDGSECTVNDVCRGGTCRGTPNGPLPEVTNDRFSGRVRFMWAAVANSPPGTLYDVAQGLASALSSETEGSETCRAQGLSSTFVDLSDAPPVGDGFWYLVRARNSCSNGSWGSSSSGQPRSIAACP